MKHPPKLSLAALPTPIHTLKTLSKRLNKKLYIKRDDTTGVLFSGNKIRKLEYLLHEALERKASAVVTCGGLESNHVRTTAFAARRLGLKPFAVLRGRKPDSFDGNTLLTMMAGADTRYVTEKEFEAMDCVYTKMDEKLRSQGHRPYFIPVGASNALGSWGYISMMEELSDQQKEMGLRFDSLFVALGSGGTQAGLIIGKHLTGNPVEIYGINVFKKLNYLQEHIQTICREVIERFDLSCTFHESDMHIFHDYIGTGYARTTDKEMEFIIQCARDEGIILDQVYTGKAFYGMVDLLKRYPDRFGTTILFLHTGGLFSIFQERERVSRLVNSMRISV